jgi:hypothetical protein
MSAPIVTPNLTEKSPEQMSPGELVQASNVLRAQVAAAPAPVPAADDVAGLPAGVSAPEPLLPEGFSEYELRTDGTLHTKLVTGEVFDGQPLDVAQKLAASKVATNRSYLEAKQRLDAIPAPTPAADATVVEQREQVAATLSSLPPDQFAELYYQNLPDPAEATAMAMARSLGYDNTDEMKQDFIDMKSATEIQRAQNIAGAFERECPEFPFTKESLDTLYTTMQDNKLPETLGNLKLAHAYCIQNKLYAPRSAEQIAVSRGGAKPQVVAAPVPPPMLAPQNTVPVNTNFANMTSDQIEAEYKKLKYSTQ